MKFIFSSIKKIYGYKTLFLKWKSLYGQNYWDDTEVSFSFNYYCLNTVACYIPKTFIHICPHALVEDCGEVCFPPVSS